MLNTAGDWWTGDEPGDIGDYLREHAAAGYGVDRVTMSACAACGGRSFRLLINSAGHDGALRACVTCGQPAFIADSEDYWEDPGATAVSCFCGADVFEIAVGFALRESGDDVTWISVGVRCVADGILGCPADWKIGYGPSLHLLEQV
jgi:hypothetical protein